LPKSNEQKGAFLLLPTAGQGILKRSLSCRKLCLWQNMTKKKKGAKRSIIDHSNVYASMHLLVKNNINDLMHGGYLSQFIQIV
jgi:hypothetical protein